MPQYWKKEKNTDYWIEDLPFVITYDGKEQWLFEDLYSNPKGNKSYWLLKILKRDFWFQVQSCFSCQLHFISAEKTTYSSELFVAIQSLKNQFFSTLETANCVNQSDLSNWWRRVFIGLLIKGTWRPWLRHRCLNQIPVKLMEQSLSLMKVNL